MRILHYSLGFPPYRSGGMIQYCFDLMRGQRDSGDEVALLWPGRMPLMRRSTRIRRGRRVSGIGNFEIISPLPVPLRNGVADPRDYCTQPASSAPFDDFLREFAPDVLHLHSIMGLHREFLESAKALNVPIVYTSHDYFGICPHVNLFRSGSVCDGVESGRCGACCSGGLSTGQIRVLQSRLYRSLKDLEPLRRARAAFRNRTREQRGSASRDASEGRPMAEYLRMFEYHKSLLALVDLFHFNSTVAQAAFQTRMGVVDSRMVHITHAYVRDKRSVRVGPRSVVSIGYIGPFEDYKGFFLLLAALDGLMLRGQSNFRLHVYGDPGVIRDYIVEHQRFDPEERHNAMKDIDVLVVPSLWLETFGFTVLEALCEGIPVVATRNVGAADLVSSEYGCLVDTTVEGLAEALLALLQNPKRIEVMSTAICETFRPESMSEHVEVMRALYQSIAS